MPADRRRAERVPITAKVTLRRSDASVVLDVDNISAGGILLRLAPAQLPIARLHEAVTVYFDVGPDAYGDPLGTTCASPMAPAGRSLAMRVI